MSAKGGGERLVEDSREPTSDAPAQRSAALECSTSRPRSPFVISVGNIAFGGRGKTPVVAVLARLLLELGERPAILSRGYGRRMVEDGVVVVSDGRHLLADVDRAGDEPLMLARDLPGVAVLVCEQRALAAAMARHTLGCTALILDDGFQHRQMARDVDVVLVTPADLKDRRVPFGRLRESVSALGRGDVLVIDDDGRRPVEGVSPERHAALFVLRRHGGVPVPLEEGVPHLAPGARILALAGIAGPERFTRAAGDAGYVVAEAWAPGDHHRYTRADVARLARRVRDSNAVGVLTTSKDAVRLRTLRPLSVPVYEWPLQVTIEPARQFADWLSARRDAARAVSR